MDNIEQRFAKMWKKSREDAGKSQQYVAKALGVSRKTVQNWETGYSTPNQLQGFRWFQVLDVPALPYYLELVYGDFNLLGNTPDDKKIEKALIDFNLSLPTELQRKVLYILHGDRGSSAIGLIELFTAYAHLPLDFRIAIAQSILTDYELVEGAGKLSNHIKPNKEILEKSILRGKKAVIENKQFYSNLEEVTLGNE